MATAAAAVAPLVSHTAAAVIATVTSVTGPGAKDTQALSKPIAVAIQRVVVHTGGGGGGGGGGGDSNTRRRLITQDNRS